MMLGSGKIRRKILKVTGAACVATGIAAAIAFVVSGSVAGIFKKN